MCTSKTVNVYGNLWILGMHTQIDNEILMWSLHLNIIKSNVNYSLYTATLMSLFSRFSALFTQNGFKHGQMCKVNSLYIWNHQNKHAPTQKDQSPILMAPPPNSHAPYCWLATCVFCCSVWYISQKLQTAPLMIVILMLISSDYIRWCRWDENKLPTLLESINTTFWCGLSEHLRRESASLSSLQNGPQ